MVRLSNIRDNHERLSKIKALIDTTSNIKRTDLERKFKGSSFLYTVLKDSNILINTPDGVIWNAKIPLTHKLTTTITTKVHEMNSAAREKCNKTKMLTNPNASTISTKIRNRKSQYITKPTSKRVSLFWGLISWEK